MHTELFSESGGYAHSLKLPGFMVKNFALERFFRIYLFSAESF